MSTYRVLILDTNGHRLARFTTVGSKRAAWSAAHERAAALPTADHIDITEV
jgi:hypothetical protein